MAAAGVSLLRSRLAGMIAEAQRASETGAVLQVLPERGDFQPAFVSPQEFRESATRWVILPGSFNPLHAGHEELLGQAVQLLRDAGTAELRGAFELSLGNAEKPALCLDTLLDRAEQFVQRSHAFFLTFTRRPLFFDKMVLVPNSVWVMGYDTAVRLVDTRFYDGSVDSMHAGFRRVRDANCRFVVAGRVKDDGHFCEAEDFVPPHEFRDLFSYLPSQRFRRDISSTEIRRRLQQQQISSTLTPPT